MHMAYHIFHDGGKFKDGNLSPGLRIELSKPFRGPTHPPAEDVLWWKQHVETWNLALPDGISFWGKKILLNLLDDEFMLKREYFAEDIRQKRFPQHPSRLQAIFGCRTLEDAKKYRDGFAVPEATVWKLSSQHVFERDMRWLRRVSSDLELQQNLLNYWGGLASPDGPMWERLLTPPVQVIDKVDED